MKIKKPKFNTKFILLLAIVVPIVIIFALPIKYGLELQDYDVAKVTFSQDISIDEIQKQGNMIRSLERIEKQSTGIYKLEYLSLNDEQKSKLEANLKTLDDQVIVEKYKLNQMSDSADRLMYFLPAFVFGVGIIHWWQLNNIINWGNRLKLVIALILGLIIEVLLFGATYSIISSLSSLESLSINVGMYLLVLVSIANLIMGLLLVDFFNSSIQKNINKELQKFIKDNSIKLFNINLALSIISLLIFFASDFDWSIGIVSSVFFIISSLAHIFFVKDIVSIQDYFSNKSRKWRRK